MVNIGNETVLVLDTFGFFEYGWCKQFVRRLLGIV